ncbi:MAG: hemolysin III family protein [Rikenellaceae bacterium]
MKLYIPTFAEEVANSVSHGVMTIIFLLLLPFAAVWAYIGGGVMASITVSIYVVSIIMMLLISTLYHSMALGSRHKEVFHILDHICIYIAIAGSYTPVALCVIGGWQGWLVFGIQWLMVVFGIFYKSLARKSIPAVSLTIYITMGWMIVIFMPRLIANASVELLGYIALGGVFYTLGAWFYARKAFRYHHLVWHLLINLAVMAHFVAIVFYL